ncbi:MAG TPA: lipid II flippase MurJ, partial [Patescibacteria group bacterium]|nr:lipid II flippase MurJ [Patescibacteria group bacterium]
MGCLPLEPIAISVILKTMVDTLFRKGSNLFTKEQTSIMSAATVITSLVFVSALLGFVKQRFLFSFFPGEISRLQVDAFLVAFRIPDFLFQLLVAGVLSATFIPVFTRVQHNSGQEARHLVNQLITLLSLVYVVFAVIVGIFAPQILRAMTGPEFSDSQVILAASMTRLMLVSTFFLLLSNFLSGILQSNKQFLLPALSPVMYNLGIIIGIVFLSKYLGIYGPAIGVILGSVAHFLVQIPLAKKFGFSYKPELSLSNPDVREVNRLMIPRGATLTTNYVEDFVGLYIVTSIGSSLVLLYNSAYQLAAAPIRFFGVSIAQAALPFLSIKAKEHDLRGLTELLIDTLHQIAFFMFPAGVLLLILRIPIVRLVFGARQLQW